MTTLAGVRVLLVEDSPEDRASIQAQLDRGGLTITAWARSSVELKARLEDGPYDVVLADHRLEAWRGTAVLTELRRSAPEVPVIVVTRSLGEEAVDACLREGAADFVLKQNLDRLPATVERVLEQRRRRDEHLRAIERVRMLSVAVDQGPATVVITDVDGTIEYVNRRFTEVTGYSKEEAIGQNPRLLRSGRTPIDTYEDLWRTVKAGGVWRGEILNRRKNGELYWSQMSISPMTGPDGVVSRFIAVHEDISERRRAEEAIREREERLRQIAENINEVCFILAADFSEALYLSPAFERVWGRPPSTVYADPWSFLEGVHPDDRPRIVDRIDRTGTGEDTGAIDFRVVHPDGTLRWVRGHAHPVLDENGAVYRISGVVSDISDQRAVEDKLRASEERFRKLIDASFDGIVQSTEGSIVEVSPSFARTLGHEPAELIGRPVLDLVAPEARQEVRRRIEDGIEGSYESVLLRKDGTRAQVEVTGRNLEIDGAPGRITALRDVTAKRALEEQFRQAQKLEAVGRLAGGVAHDFNNLLTVILSEAQLLRLGEAPDAATIGDALSAIEDATKRAAALTRQLLTFSRRDVAEPAVLDPAEAVERLRKMLVRVIGEDVALDLVTETDVGNVLIDPGHLEQVVVNLAVNARDAMPEGGRLRIELSEGDVDETIGRSHDMRPGRYVVIAVSDEGVGMTKAVQERLFEPFFTTKPAGKGTGLGLATSYGIVKDAGGHIAVYSEPDVGTTMKVYLPRVTSAESPSRAPDEPEAAIAPAATVLVVEDDEAVRRTAVRSLERLGCTVLQADGAAAALELIEKGGHRPDLLFTDVIMPGVQGPELAARVEAMLPGVKVLFATGYTSDMAFRRGLVDARANLLSKPYTPSELAHKVREALARES